MHRTKQAFFFEHARVVLRFWELQKLPAGGIASSKNKKNMGARSKLNLLLVQAFAVIYLLGGSTIVITGQDYIAIIIGGLQVIFALEGFYAAARLNRRRTGCFLGFLILNTIATGVVGLFTMIDIIASNCDIATNKERCYSATQLYAYVLLSSSGLAVIFSAIVFIFYHQLPVSNGLSVPDSQDGHMDIVKKVKLTNVNTSHYHIAPLPRHGSNNIETPT